MAYGSVLVLNATYEPINVVSIQRAVVLLLKEKAELVEAANAELRSGHVRMPRPIVIRLVYYVRIPRLVGVPLSRRTVLARDHHTCQYCGSTPGRAELTVDHVRPRSRGGETTWDNVVTACRRCNVRKGNRTPEEAGMQLRSQPARPRFVALALIAQTDHNDIWRKYMY
jgi:5-methylcytosine-specific restriction endonuclease McrA